MVFTNSLSIFLLLRKSYICQKANHLHLSFTTNDIEDIQDFFMESYIHLFLIDLFVGSIPIESTIVECPQKITKLTN